jgi:pimeloyl-ACP methyl ester carboxylesterase
LSSSVHFGALRRVTPTLRASFGKLVKGLETRIRQFGPGDFPPPNAADKLLTVVAPLNNSADAQRDSPGVVPSTGAQQSSRDVSVGDSATDVPQLFVDVRVAHDADGNPIETQNPRIVFVHGAMDRSTSFARLRRCFPDHTTVAYDRRGYARSLTVPAATSFGEHLVDLEAVVGGEPSVIVGHSYGGVVALALAAKRPDLVKALMVFEAPMPWKPWWPGNAGGSTIAAGATGGPEAAAESFMRRIVGDEIWERLGDKTRAERRAEGSALLQDLGGLREGGSPYDVSRITCPVVAGHGEKSHPHQQQSAQQVHADLLATHPELAAQFVLTVIAGATHGAHSSAAPQFAELVRHAISLASV